MLNFENKIYLLLLLLIPLLVLWEFYLRKKGKRFIFYSSKKLLTAADNDVKTLLIRSLPYIKIFSFALLIVALARPQILDYYSVENKKGIDILITLDTSTSMASVDFTPKNRLTVAKEVIANFIQKRKTDRIGLVIFAAVSYTRCPLTVDYDLLRVFLQETSIGELEDGTAIGMALANSVNRIKHSRAGTRVIILLTDGINNRGEIDPRDAADIAKDFNIKIYTIGVGTRGKAPYPMTDPYGRTQYVMLDVDIDEQLLQEIANKTGGLYFRATNQDSLQQIFSEIDRWEKTEITTRKFHKANDIFVYFVLAGLVLLLLAEFARRTLLRTLP